MTVLVAYNESPQGEAAFRAAVEEARRRATTLTVLVLTPQPETSPVPAHLTDLVETADAGAVVEIAFRSDKIDVADAILDHAERSEAEAIVIGSRKRSPVGKFLLGSTTQRVLLDAAVPVLVIKAAV
ncbi:Universal stress protein family protein [Sanguibacter gelidistatuariae]|uniref:Universal stress protein family protein n=1 Tax=Sanguibacter gelidistatuariae TaxID=1814289 RepID=A0A1G6L4X2_9MICO|nr:universal stress protein [Sanguibacter gelidistatuariae]SDC38217.1 Universal stress protein family protein [Sanguibacter gelidistatuariae]